MSLTAGPSYFQLTLVWFRFISALQIFIPTHTATLITKGWTAGWRESSETDLSEDAVIYRLCMQEAFYVTARVSVNCGGTTGGTAGSTGQTGRHWRLWRSWKTQKRVKTEIQQVKNTKKMSGIELINLSHQIVKVTGEILTILSG